MLDPQAIKDNYLVTGLTDEQLGCIAELAEERTVDQGEVLCREGERGEDLYIVIDGMFDVKIGGEVLAQVGPSTVIGEMGLIEPRPRSASVEAVRTSHVAAINQRELRLTLIENGDLGFLVLCNVARLLSERLRHADGKLAALMGAAVD